MPLFPSQPEIVCYHHAISYWAKSPPYIYLNRNKPLLAAIKDCWHLLKLSTEFPTPCKELVTGWPHYIGVKDASSHGVGGIIIGEDKACIPTVFRLAWPDDIKELYRAKKITNSDLEMAGLLLLWLVIEEVCPDLRKPYVALFSDNSPTVGWVKRLAARGSLVAMQLVRALTLRVKQSGASPLTPLHIRGEENAMTDIPSRSFGSNSAWLCKNDDELLTLFNSKFPLPNQASWTVFSPSNAVSMKVISVLRMKHFKMGE